jgi:Flp pilus assembly protein TadG
MRFILVAALAAYFVFSFLHWNRKLTRKLLAIKQRRERIRAMVRNADGTVAIEAALVFPVLLAMFIGSMTLWQLAELKSNVRFIAQSAAYAAAVVLNSQGGNPDAATAKAQEVIAANVGIFLTPTTVNPAEITFADGLITVALTAQQDALIGLIVTGPLTSTASATD